LKRSSGEVSFVSALVFFPVQGCGCEWLRDFSGWLALYCCRCGTTLFATTAPPDKPQTEQRPCRCVLQSMETTRWQTSKRTRSRRSLIGSVRSCTATIRRFMARCSRRMSVGLLDGPGRRKAAGRNRGIRMPLYATEERPGARFAPTKREATTVAGLGVQTRALTLC
jgi:hypothetical protein